MPIFQLERRYHDIWVVLDRAYQVIDSGDCLALLRRKHGAQSRRTFCLLSGSNQETAAPAAPAPWSLRELLGYGPA